MKRPEKTNKSIQAPSLEMKIHISLAENNSILGQPTFIRSELESVLSKPKTKNHQLPYFTDAIVGLSQVKLLLHANNNLTTNEQALSTLLWQHLEPLHEIFFRSQDRLKSFLKSRKLQTNPEIEFEDSFWTILRESASPAGISLSELTNLIDSINDFENKRGRPLIFETSLELSTEALSALHTLYSLLYNLRGLIADKYNRQLEDNIYGILQIDSVKDYFHAADLLTNEALLYYQFLSLKKSNRIYGDGADALNQAFINYQPYCHFLVTALTDAFFTNKNPETLEQDLYTFQVDWLLGTSAGLLYRIRQELHAIREGYESTFWPELQNEWSEGPTGPIDIQVLIDSHHIKEVSSDVA